MNKIEKIVARDNVSIEEAMKVIDHGSLKMALIVDSNENFVGVVTDGDIRRAILNGISIKQNVMEIVNENSVSLEADSSVESILNAIRSKDIIGIPLLKEKKIVDFAFIDKEGSLKFLTRISEENPNRHLSKILVIGGAGYIGSTLVRQLLQKGLKVRVLDQFLYGKESLQEIEHNENLEIIKGDTRNISDVSQALHGVDAVVHLAELVGDPACSLNPGTTQEINYLATKTIASICKHYQINRFIYISSCSVYGASSDDSFLTEESPLNPVSLYAKMKISCENALFEMEDSNFSPTILRLGTVFGFSHRPRFDLVVNILTAKAVRDGKITIFGGDQWRPHVHVTDVAKTIITVLEAPLENVKGEVFNVGSSQNNLTINSVGELVKKQVPQADVIIDEKDVDKRNYRVNFDKLKQKIGLELSFNVEDGIKEVKEFLEANESFQYQDSKHNNVQSLKTNSLLQRQ